MTSHQTNLPPGTHVNAMDATSLTKPSLHAQLWVTLLVDVQALLFPQIAGEDEQLPFLGTQNKNAGTLSWKYPGPQEQLGALTNEGSYVH